MLAGGAGHELFALGVEGFDEDADGLVEQDFVGDDLGLEAGGFEFGGDVVGGCVVLGGTGPVGRGGEDFEMLAGEGGVGHSEEGGVPAGLLGEVAVAEDGGWRCRRLRDESCRWSDGEEKCGEEDAAVVSQGTPKEDCDRITETGISGAEYEGYGRR